MQVRAAFRYGYTIGADQFIERREHIAQLVRREIVQIVGHEMGGMRRAGSNETLADRHRASQYDDQRRGNPQPRLLDPHQVAHRLLAQALDDVPPSRFARFSSFSSFTSLSPSVSALRDGNARGLLQVWSPAPPRSLRTPVPAAP